MKYVILANSSNKTFDLPKQLSNINGEPIIKRGYKKESTRIIFKEKACKRR